MSWCLCFTNLNFTPMATEACLLYGAKLLHSNSEPIHFAQAELPLALRFLMTWGQALVNY